MKKGIAILSGALMVGMLSVLPAAAAEAVYTDVPADSWYAEAVSYASENGIFAGVGDNRFDPDGIMTRGMFVTALGRMADVSVNDYPESGFSDVAYGAYYAPYVAWAAENHIVNGIGNGTFAPDTVIDREQMCTIFVRYLQEYLDYDTSAYEGAAADFADADEISSWAAESVGIAQAMGLVEGMESDGVMRFAPKDSVNRAAGVTIFVRLDRMLSGEVPDSPGEIPDEPENPAEPGGTEDPGDNNGGGTGGGGTSEDPSYSDEEIAEEAEVAGYLSNMCENYMRFSTEAGRTDAIVQETLNLLISCMNDALSYREAGGFISSDYVRSTYADEIAKVKELYSSMTDSQVSQMENVVILLEARENIYIVLDYFGVAVVDL